MRERIEILRAQQQDEFKIINHNNEIFGTCRHNPKFHRFLKDDLNVKSTSTDEGDKPERVNESKGTSRNDFFLPCPAREYDVTPPPGGLRGRSGFLCP